jgi:hypothetical protein
MPLCRGRRRSGDPRGGRARRGGYRARWRDYATTFAEKVGETALEQLIARALDIMRLASASHQKEKTRGKGLLGT